MTALPTSPLENKWVFTLFWYFPQPSSFHTLHYITIKYLIIYLLLDMCLVWVGIKVGKTVKSKGAEYAVESVNNVPQVIPEIWASEMDGDDQRITRTKSELDAVLTAATVGA